jgi:serine/threonine protein kinase
LIGSKKEALIYDFGLSRYDAGVTGTSALSGSLRWQAPERTDTDLYELNAHQSHACPMDVWSFGMTILVNTVTLPCFLYIIDCRMQELVAGRDPYAEIKKDVEVAVQICAGKLPHKPDAFVDDEMWDLCRQLWQKSAEKRPPMNVVLGKLVVMEKYVGRLLRRIPS